MKSQEIIANVKALSLPKGSYAVFGSCPLALAGIREANDIDLLVSEKVFAELKKAGWQEIDKGKNDKPLVQGIFEAHKNWAFSSYSPTLRDLLADATIADGIPFASLTKDLKWKSASGRSKDLADVELVNQYFKTSNML